MNILKPYHCNSSFLDWLKKDFHPERLRPYLFNAFRFQRNNDSFIHSPSASPSLPKKEPILLSSPICHPRELSRLNLSDSFPSFPFLPFSPLKCTRYIKFKLHRDSVITLSSPLLSSRPSKPSQRPVNSTCLILPLSFPSLPFPSIIFSLNSTKSVPPGPSSLFLIRYI